MNNYQLLIQKLDQFIRKYYLNLVIRGALYATGLILLLFLVASVLEYNFYFDTATRKLMFWSFIGISLAALIGWVGMPLLHYFRLGRVISHEQAATIIGDHFQDVRDKLLNILQLRHQADHSHQRDLVLASIDQKSEAIKLVPFKRAIDLGKNRKYLRYALPPLLILLALLVGAPYIIKDSTHRLINNNQDFEPPAPFHFVLTEEQPEVVQFEDYPLEVTIEGDKLPHEVFIDVDNYQYRLTKEAPNRFTYRFNNVQKSTPFKLYGGSVRSRPYTLTVLEKPSLSNFEVKLDYPAYTQRRDETLNSVGDLVVPVGTRIEWVFTANHTDALELKFSQEDERLAAKRFSDELFSFQRRALRDERYLLYVSNAHLPDADSVAYTLNVLPDRYPSIQAEQFVDSTQQQLLYFIGDANDDYGLRSLTFNYEITSQDGTTAPVQRLPLDKPAGKAVQFDHVFDLQELSLQPGDEVKYYFEVFDNDAVNGSKSSRTQLNIYTLPTLEELEALEDQNNEAIKEDLKKALQENKKVQEDLKKVRDKLLQKKELDWQDRKEIDKLMERQKALQQQMQEAKEKFDENLQNQEQFDETDDRIQEKQEKLQDLFEKAVDQEMQELMEQIQELLQELEKEDALQMVEEMEMNDEELETELDRLLELYKQLELEKEMTETIEKLEELAEQQEQLAEETEQEEKSQEELGQEQQEIQEEMEKIEDKMEEMKEKNEELENPQEMSDRQEQTDDIQQDMQDSQEQLQQQNNKNAAQKQKDAAQKMKEMAQGMSEQMQNGQMEQMEEDMASLRQLLENLVGISFGQEELIDELDVTSINTPRYVELTQQQFKLQDDFRLVEDSLNALAKRVMQIESFVTEKVTEIKGNFKRSIDDLEERQKPQAAQQQQSIMKNVNDLALMLSETMSQMQQQMSGMMQGKQMCNNPGQGRKPSDKPSSQGQEQLGKSLQQMKQKLQNEGGRGTAKEFAEMAAKQAALRKALEKMQRDKQQQGKGDPQLQELIEQMDHQEIDLVNKRLTNQTMERQQDILNRLLEHEKAEREREYDNQRKAEVGQNKDRKLPPKLEEYLHEREAEIEQYRSVNPNLKPYYKRLVEAYFKTLQEGGR